MRTRPVRQLGSPRSLLLPLTLLLATSACETPMRVERAGFAAVRAQTAGDALSTGEPSSFSIDVMRREGVDALHIEDPKAALELLMDSARRGLDRDVLFALAELSHLAAEDSSDPRTTYLFSACFAWLYLFDGPEATRPGRLDPRTRLACDLYAIGLARGFLDDEGDDFVPRSGRVVTNLGALSFTFDPTATEWMPDVVERYLPTAEYRIEGLANRHRRPGIGAPLLMVRKEVEAQDSIAARISRPPALAATAILRLEGDIEALWTGTMHATLEIYQSAVVREVEIAGSRVPLEADTSVAVAYALADWNLFDLELPSFFGGDDVEDYSGLYMIRPYDPRKIPIVFVHGTSSSLGRWADLINDLAQDAEIWDHYQFWFFTYLSGRPVPLSANILRQSLLDLRKREDPEGDDAAFDRTVLIGHSQGGLLSRLLVVDDPEHRLWNSIFTQPLEEMKGDEETLTLARNAFFSPPVPFVERVIYIATPHAGSFLSDRFVGRLARSLISLPRKALTTTQQLLTLNRTALRNSMRYDVPTSIDGMRTDNPFLAALATLPTRPGVKQHVIAAIDGDATPPDGDDGVVAYRSATGFEGADSVFVVRSFHSCQANPLTIAEVRRILREHVGR